MKFTTYKINPVAKPRQTRSSKWKKTPADELYYRFKDEIRAMNTNLPEKGGHIIFVRSMPLSWNPKKRDKMRFTACQSTPDLDNMCKALLDSLFKNDSHIWDIRLSKCWGDTGYIIIFEGLKTDWLKGFLRDNLPLFDGS